MRVLIWTPPWVGQGGDLFFFQNAFNKHLLLQGNTLADAGWETFVAFPDVFQYTLGPISSKLNLIPINTISAINIIGCWEDPSRHFYRKDADPSLSTAVSNWLKSQLPSKIDVILLWETPTPYLKQLYPDALIISQMPGAFARAPYPHLVNFDPNGLYRDGSISKCADSFAKTEGSNLEAANHFATVCRDVYRKNPADLSKELKNIQARNHITLLPLQISDHYAFQEETGFSSQAEYCIDVLSKFDTDKIVLITQYISRLYSDKPINKDFERYLKENFPNAVYERQLDALPSVSQYLLQEVDEVAVATTGLAVQALAWDLPLTVIKDTHLNVLDKSHVTTTAERMGILSNVIGKVQPLAELVVKDKKFLTSLIEELHSRRFKSAEERLVDYSHIDSEYYDIVMNSFRENEIRRTSKSSGGKALQLERILKKDRPSLVSFDLFDTLVRRKIEMPADLYAFLELRLRAKNFEVPFDFAQKRLDAELKARKITAADEITLRDIYECLKEDSGLTNSQAKAFYEEEIELEISYCDARPTGKALWEAVTQQGKRICITSDMYLPEECILRMLRKCKYDDYGTLYLSSSIGSTKKSGELFKYIIKESGLQPSKILHIGDTLKTDILPAKEVGLKTFHLPKSIDYFREHEFFSSAFSGRGPIAEPDRSAIIGAISSNLFDDPSNRPTSSAFLGDPWHVGYCCLGPVLIGFSIWLRRQVKSHEVKHLHFLSREGLIMKKAFDRLISLAPLDVSTNYLYGSRRALRLAGLYSPSDVVELLNQTIDTNATIGTLFEGRFGLDENILTNALMNRFGISSRQSNIRTLPDYKVKMAELANALSEEILERAAEERKVYLEYLHASGFANAEQSAIVDVGWGGNMQGALSRLLKTPMRGYYLATLSSSRKWTVDGQKMHGYIAEQCANTLAIPILKYRLLIEDMLCDVTPSIVRIRKNEDGTFEPVRGRLYESVERVNSIQPLQNGAMQFVHDICAQFGPEIMDLEFRPDLTTALIGEYLHNPYPDDANIFMSRPLDDAFSGASGRYIIAPSEKKSSPYGRNSYWEAGATAITEAHKQSKKMSDFDDAAADPGEMLAQRPLYSRILLRLAYVGLKGRLSDIQRKMYQDSPRKLFSNFRNPILIGLGRIAGVR